MKAIRQKIKNILPVLFLSLVYLFSYLPIFILILFSFSSSLLITNFGYFSLQWYAKLWASSEMLNALTVSLVVAISSTFLSIFLGTLLVIASRWWRPGWLFPLFYPGVVLPEIVLGVGLLSLFVFLRVPLGYISLITGHTVVGLALTVPMVSAKFDKIDPVLTEASFDLGASHYQTFTGVLLPLLAPTLYAASFIIFTLSLDDFFISFFCAGPVIETVSLYVYGQVKSFADPSVNALSTVLLCISVVFVLVLARLGVLKEVVSSD